MKKRRKNWLKKLAVVMALVVMMADMAPVAEAQAATGKITVKVKTPKKGAKLKGTKLTVHGKKQVQLTVKQGRTDITKKASYKSTNKTVASVNRHGRLTLKKNGRAAITIKYKGGTKKINIMVGKHQYKAHWKTKTLVAQRTRCGCGEILPDKEYKYCSKCSCGNSPHPDNICTCKRDEHIWKHVENRRNGKDEKGGNYIYEPYWLNVKYIDYYECGCGLKKKGQKEPEDRLSKATYEHLGYKTSKASGPPKPESDWAEVTRVPMGQ